MGTIRIEFNATVRKLPLSESKIKSLAAMVLKSQRIREADISLGVVGDRWMMRLTERYTGRRYRTDVLAFDLTDEAEAGLSAQVIVNGQLARERAKKFKSSASAELALYFVHGLLHLAGYDDQEADQARRMHRRSRELLIKAGFKRLPPLPLLKE